MQKQIRSLFRYDVFQTSLGWIGCLSSPKGLKRITLPQPSKLEALESLGDIRDAKLDAAFFIALESQLKSYCRGQPTNLDFQIDFSGATPFRQKVWQAIKLIPYGETRSYGWIAQQAGKPGAARAAGQAVGDNPVAIIVPCHRVIASDGSIGGFGKGVKATALKRQLLKIEKVTIK